VLNKLFCGPSLEDVPVVFHCRKPNNNESGKIQVEPVAGQGFLAGLIRLLSVLPTNTGIGHKKESIKHNEKNYIFD